MQSTASGKASLFSLAKIVLLLALCPHEIVSAAERFCPEEASVDLTDASQNATGFLSKTGHFFTIDVARNTTDAFFGCMCDIKTCVSVCSPLVDVDEPEISGPEYFSNDSVEIPPVYTTDLTLEDDEYPLKSDERFYVFTWNPCKGGQAYSHELEWYEIDVWYLLRNGSLFFPNGNGTDGTFLDWRKYCFLQNRNHATNSPIVCQPEMKLYRTKRNLMKDYRVSRITLCIGTFLAVVFLIATIFVYSVLPELRNLHGKIFRCYLCCLLVFHLSSITLLAIPWQYSTIVLSFLGLTIFSVFACFLWLNIMCFDIWRTFRGYGSLQNGGRLEEREKFIRYSIYVWCTATVLTTVSFSSIVLRIHELVSFLLWILSFCGPICGTVICNIFLFVSMSITLFHHKRNTQRQLSHGGSQRHGDNMALFNLYLKLFVIMVLSWPTDLIPLPWTIPDYYMYFMDMVNALQSISIFVLFVCKKKIWQSLKIRFKRSRDSNGLDALRHNQIRTSTNA